MASSKLKQLASKLCKLESKKSQIKMGDMEEALSILGLMVFEEYLKDSSDTAQILFEAGRKRAKRRKRK